MHVMVTIEKYINGTNAADKIKNYQFYFFYTDKHILNK